MGEFPREEECDKNILVVFPRYGILAGKLLRFIERETARQEIRFSKTLPR